MNTSIFKEALREWNKKPAVSKTWINFKTHFRAAVKEYKQLRGPSVNDSIYKQQHANLMNQSKDDLRHTIAEEIQRHIPSYPPQIPHSTLPFSPADPYCNYLPADDSITQQLSQMANSISQYQQVVPTLVNQVKELQKIIKNLEKSSNRSLPSQITSDTSTITTTSTTSNGYTFIKPFHEYCYTHGLCAHKGSTCRAPSDSHIADATFFNRMGGSEKNIHRAKKKK